MSDRVVFWDFDGTLGYRVSGKWAAALHQALLEQLPGVSLTVDDLRPFLNKGFPWHHPEIVHTHLSDPEEYWAVLQCLFADVYRQLGLSETAVALAERVRYHYTNPSGWALYDDVISTFDRLSAHGWSHALISNHVPELTTIVQSLGLAMRLDLIVNSADVGYEKPHPRIFEIARKSMGQPRAAWMVGDNAIADVMGAEAAGIPAILVRRQYPDIVRQSADLIGAAEIVLAADSEGNE